MTVDRCLGAFGLLACNLPADRANLTLQVPDAGLPRVAADDGGERRIRERHALGRQAVVGDLTRHEVIAGDAQFLLFRVAGESSTSIRSRSGPGIVSSTLAVVMKSTPDRSNGTSR